MRLYTYGVPCTPIPEEHPKFMQSVLREETRVIYDQTGHEVSKQVVNVSIPETIPEEVFENRGITCDLFELEVQQKAGVQLHQFEGQFYGVTLDNREAIETQLNASLDNIENQLKQGDESIKFD